MLASRSDAGDTATAGRPSFAALALSGAALFFGGGPGDGSPALARRPPRCSRSLLLFAATRRAPERLRRARAARALAVWCAALDRLVDRARPQLGLREPRARLRSPSRSSAPFLAGRPRRARCSASAALLGAVCAWSLAGKALPWLYEDYGRIARLRGPVGYWNALALLGDIALPLGLCLATRLPRRRDAARLRLDRRDRADLLARRRRSSRVLVVAAWIALSRAWVEALATLVAAGLPRRS